MGIPGPTAQNGRIAIPAGPGRAVSRRTPIGVIPAILGPLPHVAVYLEQAPWIRFQRVNRHGLLSILTRRVFAVVVGLASRDRGTQPEWRSRACSRHVLALGFAQQMVITPGLTLQPRYVGLSVVPTHIDHRSLAAAPIRIGGLVIATCAI